MNAIFCFAKRNMILLLLITLPTLAISQQTNPIDSIVTLSRSFSDNQKFETAIKELEKGLDSYKKSDKLYNELAYCYYQSGNYNASIRYATKLIDLQTELSGEGYVTRCASLEALKMNSEAEKSYKKGIEQYPTNKQLLFNYAQYNLTQKNGETAEELIIQALLIEAYNPSYHKLLYQIALNQNNRAKALLAILNYSLLIQDEGESKFAFKEVLRLWCEPSNTVGNKYRRLEKANVDFDGFGFLEKTIIENNARLCSSTSNIDKLSAVAQANQQLITAIQENSVKHPNSFWFTNYLNLLYGINKNNYHSQAVWYMARNAYSSESLSEISKDVKTYANFTVWFEKELMPFKY